MGTQVMIVDDDVSICDLLTKLLKGAGYDVTVFHEAHKALAMLKTVIPTVIITDIIMPEMDGLELIREIRKQNPMIRMIALSGGGRLKSGFYLELASKMKVDAVMEKPFKKGELLALIDKFTAESKGDGSYEIRYGSPKNRDKNRYDI